LNTTGEQNTATGFAALYSTGTGNNNTANGYQALNLNTTGQGNTANGVNALHNNTAGSQNTANGAFALHDNTTGNNNIALGFGAGSNLTIGNSNIDIGNMAVAGESGTIRLGQGGIQTRTFIAAIRGVTTGNADAINVVIDSNGQLGTLSSSRRFKKEIKAMEQASEAILAPKPVTFHYKSDATGTPQFGLIAEEVAEVNPDLVARDDGEIYTVRYDAVNAMSLNEFLKVHRTVKEQGATIAQLKSTMARQQKDFGATVAQLTARLDEQEAQLQKVSVQLEANKPGPQMVVNNR
jgi:hypothetical protein